MTVPFLPPRAAYIHVPFCVHRCGYCDFTLVAGRDHLMGDYLRAMEIELGRLSGKHEIDTLFFGGGTPTQLPPDSLARLFEIVLDKFSLAKGYEFSVEANPAGLSSDHAEVMVAAGVNRISLGLQSFDAGVLGVLERDHRADQIAAAVELLRKRFDNIAFDLIFAVPGQTLDLWKQTLRTAIEYQPQHISTYGLTFEKGTSFWSRREKSELIPATSELERAMYATAIDELPAAGFEQYEISNFAQPGFRCRHNETYWAGGSHFGFGPGAARYLEGRRTTNHRSVDTWLRRILAGEEATGETEKLSTEERAREMLAIGIRRRDGIQTTEFRSITGFELQELAGDAVERMIERGWLEIDADAIRLTREGLFFADHVSGEFL